MSCVVVIQSRFRCYCFFLLFVVTIVIVVWVLQCGGSCFAIRGIRVLQYQGSVFCNTRVFACDRLGNGRGHSPVEVG